jgi:hypothetical protein
VKPITLILIGDGLLNVRFEPAASGATTAKLDATASFEFLILREF